MTGFGDASIQHEGVHLSAEIRSVNNRYFKASVRLPEELFCLESELEALLRGKVSRGHVTLHLGFKDASEDAAQEVNLPALKHYLSSIQDVRHVIQSNVGDGEQRLTTIELTSLLQLPGVMQQSSPEEIVNRLKKPILELVETAATKMVNMRQTEGAGLVRDLLDQKSYIEQRLENVATRVPVVVEEYHERLKARVAQLLSRAELNLDETDLAREIALYAERCDIAEELQRLRSHLSQLDLYLNQESDEPIGRTLDFLAQELLREANTIASKSNDAFIALNIVEIKGAIDRIKEQVQNVE